MYLEKLNNKMPIKDYIKNLACEYLAKRYNKSLEFFLDNLEEQRIKDKFYYKRTDEDGKRGGIIYFFTDDGFGFYNGYSYQFDEDWIKFVYFKLLKVSPNLASDYMREIRIEMKQAVNEYIRSRFDEIDNEYKSVVESAKFVRDQRREGLRLEVAGMKEKFDKILDDVKTETKGNSINS